MNIEWGLIAGFFYLNALVGIAIAIRSWNMRSRPGLGFFALLAACAAFYSITYGLEIASAPLALKIFWLKTENISIVALAPFWFLFAIRFTRQADWLTNRRSALLFLLPAITLFLLASKWSYLQYSSAAMSDLGGPLMIQHGIWYWIQIAYNYSLLLAGALVILWGIARNPQRYRGQKRIIFPALAIPLLTNLYFVFGSRWFPLAYLMVDLTPFAASVSGALYSIGIFNLRLGDLMPMARDIVFENIPELVIVLDTQNRIVDLNHTGYEWLDLAGKNIQGLCMTDILHGFPELSSYFSDNESVTKEIQIPGASSRDLELVITPLLNRRGQFSGRLVVGRDITARKQADRLLEETSKRMNLQSEALNAAANAIIITDSDGFCIWINPAFTEMTGYSMQEMLGERLSKLKSGEQGDDFYRNLWETILKGEVWNGEIVNRHKDGHHYTEEMTIAPVRNGQGEITNFIAIKQDITSRKMIETNLRNANRNLKFQMAEIETLQEKLREQAIRDSLTGLFNRRYLDETLEREIAKTKRDNQTLCVAMVDVDHFKSFNDQYGHMVGDMILESLSKLLLNKIRQGDIACRYGGDELLVVMPGMTAENAFARAEEWRLSFEASGISFNLKERRISISVGLACYPIHGHNATYITRAADQALYQAKHRGRNVVVIYDELA